MTATTTDSRDFDVQQLTDTVKGVFASKTAFMGSVLAAQGAVIVRDTMKEGDASAIGNDITIPYFGTLGEFASNAEDVAVTPTPIQMTNETATVARSSLAFEVTRWAQHSGPEDADPYEEAARQILESATRRMDALVVTEAATTPLIKNVYNATTPGYLDYDTMVDAQALWGDRQDDIIAMVCHSRTQADLRKLKDGDGKPLIVDGGALGSRLTTFCGVPLVISDKVPLTGSSMGTVTEVGAAVGGVGLTGTPTGPWNLQIDIVVGGARGTATFRFSTDGGNTWSATLLTAATVVLTDTAKDSLVGLNGTTGLTATFGVATYDVLSVYSSTALLKATSLICQKGALAFWFNRKHMSLQTDRDILKDNDVAAMHIYHCTKMYRRRPGSVKPGIVAITHNLRNYIG